VMDCAVAGAAKAVAAMRAAAGANRYFISVPCCFFELSL
jgi:hypothetical protein